MAEIFITLDDAAELSGVDYEALKKRLQRNPDRYMIRFEPSPNGGKPRVLVALSSLSGKAQRKYEKEQRKLERDAAMLAAPAPERRPWYADVEINWFLDHHADEHYKALETVEVIEAFLLYDEAGRTAHAEQTAKKLGVSLRTFYRLTERYKEAVYWAGRMELETGNSYDYFRAFSLCRKPRETVLFPSLPPEQRALVENIWFDETFAQNQGTVTMLYDVFEEKALENGWTYPGYQTVLRYIEHLMEVKRFKNAHILAAKGVREYRRTVMKKGIMDTSNIPVMGIVQGDAHTFDFWVKYTDPANGSVSAIRPTLVAWIDVRSRKVMGAVICKHSNAFVIKHSLAKLVYENGVPQCVHNDNGKDFTAKEITGRNRKERGVFMLDAEADGFLKSVGIVDNYRSLPYQAWGKGIIERFFLTVCLQFSRWFLSYTGTLTGSKTAAKIEKDIPKMLKADTLITMDECYELFEKYLDKYHNRKHGGLKAMGEQYKTPASLFDNAEERYNKPTPPLSYLERMMGKAEDARVYQTGIRRFDRNYMNPALDEYIGEFVKIRWNPEDLSKLAVYSQEGKLICDAQWEPLLSRHGFSTGEEVAAHKRTQNSQLAKDRERVSQSRLTHAERVGMTPIAGKLDMTVQNRQPKQVISLPADKQYREEMAAQSSKKQRQPSQYLNRMAEEALEQLSKIG